ncbi:hypothetical protein A2U01_0085624, partial [Trifolium medium]|nr:hypothetical protein [Trifolium medium]
WKDEDKAPKISRRQRKSQTAQTTDTVAEASGTTINTRTRSCRMVSPPPILTTLNPPTQGRRTRTTPPTTHQKQI